MCNKKDFLRFWYPKNQNNQHIVQITKILLKINNKKLSSVNLSHPQKNLLKNESE